MKRRLSIILIVAILMSCVLVGCKKSDNTDTESGANVETHTEVSGTETETETGSEVSSEASSEDETEAETEIGTELISETEAETEVTTETPAETEIQDTEEVSKLQVSGEAAELYETAKKSLEAAGLKYDESVFKDVDADSLPPEGTFVDGFSKRGFVVKVEDSQNALASLGSYLSQSGGEYFTFIEAEIVYEVEGYGPGTYFQFTILIKK